MIGDPSGRSKTRPPLTLEETRRNGESYFAQATKILSPERVQMRYNSEWLAPMQFADVIRLGSRYTVARMLERDDFERRYRGGEPISIHEFLYPLAQAQDSVAIRADIELGGTDQKFNLLVGRDLQREEGMDPQVTLTMPILPGTDGVEKMSKSLDNTIGITDPPGQMYGRTLSIPDTLIEQYFVLVTDVSAGDLAEIRSALAGTSVNPRDLKRRLAREIVTLYHGAAEAQAAEEEFDRVFIQKSVPQDVPEVAVTADGDTIGIVKLLVSAHLVTSGSDARRLIAQGGVSVDGTRITEHTAVVNLTSGVLVRVGKLRVARVRRA
jgi:tyrosyl-tRNA synthetase